MFKAYYGVCNGSKNHQGCGRENQPIKTKRGLCPYCEQDRKQEIKADREKPAKKKPLFKPTGEYALFLAIAASRPHVCFVTGEPVRVYVNNGNVDVWTMAHVLAKKPWKKFQLYDKNIVILAPWVHQVYDRGNAFEREQLENWPGGGWKKLMELREELKTEYYAKHE